VHGTLIVEVRRAGKRLGCWEHKDLTIEAGDRLCVIDSAQVVRETA
jgi:hypothetical protein